MRRLIILIALVAVAAGVAACGSGAQSRPSGGAGAQAAPSSASSGGGTEVRVALPTAKTSFANSDIAVADEQGFFKQQGISVKVIHLASGVKAVQAVIGHAADIGGSSIEPVLAAQTQGQKLKIFAAYADRLTVNMTTPTSVASASDLAGKPVGIQDVGAFREIMTRFVLHEHGMTPDDVSYRPVSSDGYTSALAAGQIESGILQPEQYYALKAENADFHSIADLYRMQPRWFYGTYFAADDWLGDHADEATAYATAITQAHRFMYTHRAETVKIVAAETGFPASAVNKAYAVLLRRNDVFPTDGGLSGARIAYTLSQMEKLKALPGSPPEASSVIDTGPTDEAVQKLGDQPRPG